MGNGTFVKERPLSPEGIRLPRLRIDVPLLLIVMTILVYGLVMVYSASTDFSSQILGKGPLYVLLSQLRSVGIGLVLGIVASIYDYHLIKRWLPYILVGTLLLLSYTAIFGRRGIFGGSVQPSELAKLVIIVYIAFWLSSRIDKLNDITIGILPMAVLLGVTGGLILKQPDLSAGATIILLGGLLFFLAGGDWKQILIVLVGGLGIGWVIINFNHTGQTRWAEYINGLLDPVNSQMQIARSLEAVVKGKFLGVGIGNGQVKLTGLPLPHSDTIFAVVAEEMGLFGVILMVGLFCLLLWRGLVIARRSPDILGSLLAAGLTFWITFEAMANMAMIAGLFPVLGNALPLVSYGGSNMVVMLIGIGLLMNVARQSVEKESSEGSKIGAVIDLRRRNGRGRIPRADRSASAEE